VISKLTKERRQPCLRFPKRRGHKPRRRRTGEHKGSGSAGTDMDTSDHRDPLKEEMKTALKPFTTTESAEFRLMRLGVELPALPEPFGVYAEGVQTGNLLFLTGMLPTEGRSAKSVGRLGSGTVCGGVAQRRSPRGDQCSRRRSPAPWVARQGYPHCAAGRLVATSGDVRDQPKVADGASEFLQDLFGKERNPSRLVYGIASLPLGTRSNWKSFSKWRARETLRGKR